MFSFSITLGRPFKGTRGFAMYEKKCKLFLPDQQRGSIFVISVFTLWRSKSLFSLFNILDRRLKGGNVSSLHECLRARVKTTGVRRVLGVGVYFQDPHNNNTTFLGQ